MPQGIYKRGRPIQKKLEKLKKIILIDALNRKKTAKEMANDYGVSYGALLIYFKENKINKFRKLVPHYTKSNMGHKSKVKDLRNYIKENNITKPQIMEVVLSMAKDGFLTSKEK